jgi:hypothetical protein
MPEITRLVACTGRQDERGGDLAYPPFCMLLRELPVVVAGLRLNRFVDHIFTELCDMAVLSCMVTNTTRCSLDVERSVNVDLATFN